ncbi:MAG: hypothetical protein KC586_26645 [Myxococcales bacterium]|nr:hypothetical protein [Myxococcales bacterium]
MRPLLSDARPAVRSFGLDLARYELARWAPPIEAIVALCESEHGDVRAFVEKALLAGDGKEHARYRIDPATLTTDAVYSFCESLDAGTRALGMQLIANNPRLAVPEELFRLTESPDRQVRAMVVRTLWKLFRDRGTTNGWVPAPPPSSILTKKKGAPEPERELPEPRHTTRPASDDALVAFFRRILFTLPPARPPLERGGKKKKRLRPLPSRRAKLELIQVMRDLAVEDTAFAGVISPVLEEFMGSRGRSEHAACLVALTRIRHAAGGAS